MKTSGFKLAVILIIITAFFISFNLLGFGPKIKNFFYLFSSPIQKVLWRAGDRASNFFETISEIKNLKKENKELKLKIQELLAENVALKELKKENEILRGALEIGLEKEFRLMLVQITGKDISQDFILIDKGAKDGILEDFPVISQQKNLIGKISQVYKNFSKVMLITNKESSFDAKIQDSEILGAVKGKGNLRILFDLIPKEKEIKKGDLVVTSALGGVFPEGLIVGEISEVKKSDIEPFQMAQIQPAFDIGGLEKLFIIIEW